MSTRALLRKIPGQIRKAIKPPIAFFKGEELRCLREELDLYTSYSVDTVYRLHYDTMSYDSISPSVTRLLGFTVQEMKRLNFRNLILETRIVTDGMKSVESFDALEKKRKAGDVNKWEADYLIRTKDGGKKWISDISYPWFDKGGAIIGSIGSLRDITDRIRVEAEVHEKLSTIANTDALTGFANRRSFFDLLERELKLIHRTGNDLAMLLVDLDHFRDINGKYGKDVADFVLVEVSRIIHGCIRETDFAARLDGEEFGIILPDTPKEGAYWVAERIRSGVVKHLFQAGSDKEPVGCTVCVGVAAAMHGMETDAATLYKTADMRLYIAKNTGRNQVSADDIHHTH